MYVYVLLKEYQTGASVVEQVFSSKKKAEEHLQWLVESAIKDGWTVVRGEQHHIYRWFKEGKVYGTMIVPPSGRAQSDTFYILKEQVA